jgi:site-specific DNA-methyltransferase (adenine-specific)
VQALRTAIEPENKAEHEILQCNLPGARVPGVERTDGGEEGRRTIRMKNTVIQGDCLDVLKTLPDGSVDMVLCDPPYGVTSQKWDVVLDMEVFWPEVKRIVKPGAPVVFTATQPYATEIILSNRRWFKYEWVWVKSRATMFFHAKHQPLRVHEYVLVFCDGATAYYPQSLRRVNRTKVPSPVEVTSERRIFKQKNTAAYVQEFENYPKSVLEFDSEMNTEHGTQKPVALFEYLIRTYTNPGDTVLDPTAGSGTTGVACRKSGRNFILIEREEKYCTVARRRISEVPESLFDL